ncbi:MAG TPA: hypothetical protein VEH49_09855 [Methylomirabilota bacterium]|nr:hypothetical protein [Methylomirabilota bacterium]
MKHFPQRGAFSLAIRSSLGAAALLCALPACSQQPRTIDTTAPIVIKQVKPQTGNQKFKGTVMHANNAQITVRARNNELIIRTFPLSTAASQEMQRIIDRGGYQYGDKVEVIYDPVTQQALKVKGKPSRPI